MAGRATYRLTLLAAFCLLVLPGCKDAGKQQAIADANAARATLAEVNTQLEKVKAELAATQKERDGLKKTAGDLSASLESVKTKLAAEQATALKDQVTQLTRDRDAALAKLAEARGMVEKLKSQVQEQMQKVGALQEQSNPPQQSSGEPKKAAPAAATATVAPGTPNAGQPTPPTGAGPAPASKKIDLGNGANMEFVLIPAGNFEMGSPDSEKGRDGDEGPVHKVQITKAFYMAKYEVTQGQYQAVMGTNPSKFSGQNLPVETVSWDEAATCCRKIGGRLPTEAEWEYACRAGSRTRFCYGDDLDGAQLGEYGWHSANSGSTTHPVGQKKPNSFGLYDIHGNVYEWCSDWFAAYTAAQAANPVGASSGQNRVCRGGGWIVNAGYCRCANRHVFAPDFRSIGLGFRVVLDAN